MSASTLYWTGGAGDFAFMTAGNWNTARDGSGSSLAPGAGGAGDTLIIESTNQNITGGVTGISVASLNISFGGSVGSAGTPLNIAVSGTLTIRTASGTHYFQAVSAGTIVNTEIKMTGQGKVFLSGPGAYTTIRVGTNCQVDIGSNCAVATLKTSGGTIEVAANGTAFTTLEVAGGTTTSYRGAATAHISGNLITKGIAAAITNANVYPGGKHTNWSSSTIANSNVRPNGQATSKGSPYSFIVTDRESHEGSKNYTDSTNVTFSNAATVVGDQYA